MQDRTCADCGADITTRHGNARRCRDCQAQRAKAQQGQGVARGTCSVDDSECVAGRLRGGMCERHYRRFKTTGSTDAPGGKLYHLSRYRVTDSGCWQWTGPMFWNGYGHISAASFGTTLAHRAFYEAHRGPIPERDLDHLCRNRACVNPDHLEPVSHAANVQRGVYARMGHECGRGHDQTAADARWTEPSTGRTYCRECKALREKRRREQRKAG